MVSVNLNLVPARSGSLSSTPPLILIHAPRSTVGLSTEPFASNEALPSLYPAVNILTPFGDLPNLRPATDILPPLVEPPSLQSATSMLPPLVEAGLSHSESSSQGNPGSPSGLEESKTPTEKVIAKEVKPAKKPVHHRPNIQRIKAPLANKLPSAVAFKFDPQVYSQASLLQTYPSTFCPPAYIDILTTSAEILIRAIEETVYIAGKPLVIYNFHLLELFDKETFSLKWLKANMGTVEVAIRDLKDRRDERMPLSKFLAGNEGKSFEEIKYYGKDIDCPPEWHSLAKKFLPPHLHYLGANDISRLLPEELQAENLMIYVGHEGTYTSSHFDICGSIGHNLMVHADEGCSALWFMVGQDDADKARKFWHKNGGGNTSVDQDNFTISAEVLGQADFPVHVFEQRLGDFVMVPSESAHQVINLGPGVNIKYSYNRNMVHTIDYCLNKILPVNRRILKMETYRIKAMIEHGVLALGQQLSSQGLALGEGYTADDLARDYSVLLKMYAKIIAMDAVDSSYTVQTQQQPEVSDDVVPHARVCDFCHCDIWNTWFHCDTCVPVYGHDFCSDCVAENRQCLDYQRLTWYCHRPVQMCFQDLKHFSEAYNSSPLLSTQPSFSPVPLYSAISELESLHPDKYSPTTYAVRNNDFYKTAAHKTCHQCASSRFKNDLVRCTQCKTKVYCHTCLSGRYGANPSELALDKNWTCYCCRKLCNCNKCRTKFGEANTLPLAEHPCCLTDYNGNYNLCFELSYYPINFNKYLVPNVVDCQTFLQFNRPLPVATNSKVIKKLIPYTGPLVEDPNEPKRKQAAKRKFTKDPNCAAKKHKGVAKKPEVSQQMDIQADGNPGASNLAADNHSEPGPVDAQLNKRPIRSKPQRDNQGPLDPWSYPLPIVTPQNKAQAARRSATSAKSIGAEIHLSNPASALNSDIQPAPGLQACPPVATRQLEEEPQEVVHNNKRKGSPEIDADGASCHSPSKKLKEV
ncbi:hypothetical protein DSO57_1017411 [Entomophthora muscae]|uniref:Uncharacterized protein n=2 Tax=Entomophthora muscae TaxID=34485 RepID=A0ACC2TFZ7_9FUNG|nr:hypothetical protein DSO57_1017411 [Entomophthora muscae]